MQLLLHQIEFKIQTNHLNPCVLGAKNIVVTCELVDGLLSAMIFSVAGKEASKYCKGFKWLICKNRYYHHYILNNSCVCMCIQKSMMKSLLGEP